MSDSSENPSEIKMNGLFLGFFMSFVSLIVLIWPLVIIYLFQQTTISADPTMPDITNMLLFLEIAVAVIAYVPLFIFMILTKRYRSAIGFLLGVTLTLLAVPLLLVFACFSMVSNIH